MASRITTHPAIDLDCPVCGLPLPPITVDAEARAEGRRMVVVDLRVQELDAAWWAAARAGHPGCIPDELGPVS